MREEEIWGWTSWGKCEDEWGVMNEEVDKMMEVGG